MTWRKRALEALDADIREHIELETQENIDRGMAPEEARRRAMLKFGNVALVKEDTRAVWVSRWLDEVRQDLWYGLRTLRRNRATTLVGILIMALGIGANTAVFSVVHAVLLNPLPYANPDRIVTLTYLPAGANASGDRSKQVSVPDFLDWQAQSTAFDAMAYYSRVRTSVMARTVADYAVVSTVAEDFFRVFAAQPSIGRSFTHEEGREGGTGAAMVSDRYARQEFGEPIQAIGRTLRLFNRSVPIVGVLPPAFDYPLGTDVWFTAVGSRAQLNRRGNNFRAVARLKADVHFERAQTELTAISERLEAQYPDSNKNVRVIPTPLQREMVGDVASMLYLLLGAVALVLLIACATMATLLLVKATARTPEIAIRAALGASRSRIVRQLLVEASVQAFGAAVIGVTTAVWATRALVALAPPDIPRLDEVSVNSSVLLFSVVLSALVSILFGLPPALQASRVDVDEPLRHGGGRLTGRDGSRAREALVVAEIALAVVLVATGALLVRSLVALQQAPLGFEPAKVLLMETTARPRQPDWSDSRAFFQALLVDIQQLPGVLAAGAMMGPPGHVESDSGYWIDRMPTESPLRSARPAAMNVIAPGTFDALGISIREGRDFTDGDMVGRPRVAIVNQALARAAFSGRDAIGRVIIAGYDSLEPMTIVGVVSDVRQYGPGREPQPEVYMPYLQHMYNGATLRIVVRSATDAAALGASIQRKARERSPEVSVRLTTMNALLAQHVATPKFRAWLLSLFAIVALCLAMAGIYGVMGCVAAQRSKEIGVRMALGASTAAVLWLMLGRGLKLTAIGLTVGVLGALASTRLVSGMLFDIKPHDAVTYTAVIAGLGLLSLLATYVPARRATQIDPLVVLRQE
jgi:putative ABC transport system permease protein